MKNSTIKIIAMLIIIGTLVYEAYDFKTRKPFEEMPPAVGAQAPDISLSDMAGNMIRLSDYSGKVVLVNFWASWCPPCKDEMPSFQKMLDAYGEKDLAVIAVAIDEPSADLVRELGMNFPVLRINERVARDYGKISDVPVSFLIGRDGRILKKVKKVYPEDRLKADLEAALKK